MPELTVVEEYQALLAEISRIYEDAKDSTLIAVNKIRNQAYWMIGERIIKVEQKGAFRAQYGSRLIENLSRDLGFKYADGFSETNLRAMRKFYLTHKNQQPAAELSWTNYRLLLAVKDDKKRQFYEERAIREGWSKSALRKALKADKVEIEEDAASLTASLPDKRKTQLSLRRGKLFTYQLKTLQMGSKEKPLLVVDCGFSYYLHVPLDEVPEAKSGDFVRSAKTGPVYQVEKMTASKLDLYTYRAVVSRAAGADTLLVNIDCGFGLWAQQPLRLRGIHCPAASTRRGQRVQTFIQDLLKNLEVVVIKTYPGAQNAPYLADVFYLPQERNPVTVAEKGHFLNQELVDQNMATLGE